MSYYFCKHLKVYLIYEIPIKAFRGDLKHLCSQETINFLVLLIVFGKLVN